MLIRKMFVRSKYLRKLIVKLYSSKEEGVFRSSTIRFLYKKYRNIDAGYGSYGWASDLFDGPAIIGKYISIGKKCYQNLC